MSSSVGSVVLKSPPDSGLDAVLRVVLRRDTKDTLKSDVRDDVSVEIHF